MYDCNYTPHRCLWVCLFNRMKMDRWWWKVSWIFPGECGDPSGWKYKMISRHFHLFLRSRRTPSVQSAHLETRGSFSFLLNIIIIFDGYSFSSAKENNLWDFLLKTPFCWLSHLNSFEQFSPNKHWYTSKYGPKNASDKWWTWFYSFSVEL